MKRPTIYDAETRVAVAKRMSARFAEWLDDESTAIEVEKDLIKAFKDAFDWDAYAIARAFDRMEYFVDSSLFYLMEGASLIAHDETQKRLKAWVIAEGILPAFAVGDQVSMPDVDGAIIRVDAETAEYVVQCPSVGHSGAAGYVVGFEIVRAR